jgi:enoyl-[acyl-carrier protein] reductase II
MKTTRVTEILGIQYPILQGGMLWLADAGLAAAVSNAGGLGVISPMAGMEAQGDPVENLTIQISKAKELTDKPFGVNVPLDLRDSELLMDVIFAFEVPVIVTAAGDPRLYTELFHAQDARVIHVISSVKHAQVAEAAGVDAIVAEGVEAAARNGFDEIPLFSLIPQIADAVKIPVIAAGGIADARGVAAAFALGAEGVQLGTRFVAVEECIAAQAYKDAIVEAGDTDTAITNRALIPTRSLKTTAFSQALLALQEGGATAEEISDFMGHAPSRRGGLEGDLDNGEAYCSSSGGLIKEVLDTNEAIQQLVKGYAEVIKSL